MPGAHPPCGSPLHVLLIDAQLDGDLCAPKSASRATCINTHRNTITAVNALTCQGAAAGCCRTWASGWQNGSSVAILPAFSCSYGAQSRLGGQHTSNTFCAQPSLQNAMPRACHRGPTTGVKCLTLLRTLAKSPCHGPLDGPKTVPEPRERPNPKAASAWVMHDDAWLPCCRVASSNGEQHLQLSAVSWSQGGETAVHQLTSQAD
jgi:hypothetical protein